MTVAEVSPTSAGAGHRLIPLEDAGAWDAALDGIPHAFAHTRAWCSAMQRTSQAPTSLYEFRGGGGRVVCPLAVRDAGGRSDVVTPYGFAGFTATEPHPRFPDAWRAFAASRGWVAGYVALHPALPPVATFPPSEVSQANELFVLDLTRPADELHRALDRNRRRQLRDWAALRATTLTDPRPLTEFFVTHCADVLRRAGATGVYAFADETLQRLAEADGVLLAGRGSGGRVEAVSVFAWTPYAGEHLFHIALPGARHHAAPLVWWGVHELRARGVPSLNLGGGVRPGDGIAHYKARFGARRVPLTALRQVFDEPAYAALCRARGQDPSDRDGWFPAYRAPA